MPAKIVNAKRTSSARPFALWENLVFGQIESED